MTFYITGWNALTTELAVWQDMCHMWTCDMWTQYMTLLTSSALLLAQWLEHSNWYSGRSWVWLPLGNSENLFLSIWLKSISTFLHSNDNSNDNSLSMLLWAIPLVRKGKKAKKKTNNKNEISCDSVQGIYIYISKF